MGVGGRGEWEGGVGAGWGGASSALLPMAPSAIMAAFLVTLKLVPAGKRVERQMEQAVGLRRSGGCQPPAFHILLLHSSSRTVVCAHTLLKEPYSEALMYAAALPLPASGIRVPGLWSCICPH